jgi:hypothetical protein
VGSPSGARHRAHGAGRRFWSSSRRMRGERFFGRGHARGSGARSELPTRAPRALDRRSTYDSYSLDAELAEKGSEVIAPYRRNWKKAKIQDGRKLRRYKRRWKVERLFAWLGNFRRLVVRYERRRELPWLCEAGMPRNPTEVFVRWVLALHLSCRLVSELSRTIKGANLRVV